MKLFRQIIEDIRRRQNFDIYLTALLALVVSVLNTFQVASQAIIASAVLATLALISISLLVNRRDNAETQVALSKIGDVQQRIDGFVSSLGATFAFVPISEGRYQVATEKVRKRIAQATQEVLVLDYIPLEDIESKVRYRNEDKISGERRKYHATLIEKAIGKPRDFRYRRLIQVPKGRRVSDILADDPLFREHCEALVKLGEKQPEVACLKSCAVFQERSFIIVDRRYLVLEWVLLDPEDRYYSGGGYLVFDDPSGDFISNFLRFFERADANATIVKFSELSQ